MKDLWFLRKMKKSDRAWRLAIGAISPASFMGIVGFLVFLHFLTVTIAFISSVIVDDTF
jgi:hypothetical protein